MVPPGEEHGRVHHIVGMQVATSDADPPPEGGDHDTGEHVADVSSSAWYYTLQGDDCRGETIPSQEQNPIFHAYSWDSVGQTVHSK